MQDTVRTLVLLDGDQNRLPNGFIDPDTIPCSKDDSLGELILEATKVKPEFTIDGGPQGGNRSQHASVQRKYLAWLRKNVRFIPTICPEELILIAAGKTRPGDTTSSDHKSRLRELTVELYGADATNERTDSHGETLLAQHRACSKELLQLAQDLVDYLATS